MELSLSDLMEGNSSEADKFTWKQRLVCHVILDGVIANRVNPSALSYDNNDRCTLSLNEGLLCLAPFAYTSIATTRPQGAMVTTRRA